LIDAERRHHYQQTDAHFESRYIMTFTYQTPTETESRLRQWLIQQEKSASAKPVTIINYFNEVLSKLENTLSNHLLLERLDSQQLLTWCHTCITGLSHELHLPKTPLYLDSLLATQDLVGGLQPKIGEHFIKAIAIAGLPLESEPG